MKTKTSLIVMGFFLFVTFAYGESNLDFFFKDNARYKDVTVEEVISTDTIKLDTGEIIKLIGLHAPEVLRKHVQIDRDQYGFEIKKDPNPIIPMEDQALDFAMQLLKGQHIRLEFDVEKKDLENKTLAYIFIIKGNIFANTEILRQGFADLQIRPPNSKYNQELREAYTEAKKEKRGLQSE